MNANRLKIYSCRFEGSLDYTKFVVAADKCGAVIYTGELHHFGEGAYAIGTDIYVEFRSEAELETLQDILRNGEDLHVGLQTLRQVPMRANSMESDYSLI